MSLADRLSTIAPTTTCLVCVWYRTLAKEDKAAFDRIVPRVPDEISYASFHRECAEEGLPASETSFKRHLKNHRDPR
jgi:hypothetical protein